MNIHEYQGKEVFRKFGVPTPRGIPVFTVDEAVRAAESLGGKVSVVRHKSFTPLVAKFYPKWYTGSEPLPPPGEPERH